MWYKLTCKSKFVVYLITCLKCRSQYVGATECTMMARHTQHRQEIHDLSTTLGRHFDKCGYGNLSLQIIACVKEGDLDALEKAEGFWQHNLATFIECGGLNTIDEFVYKGRKRKMSLNS